MDSSNGPALIWGTIVIVSIVGSLMARRMQWRSVPPAPTASVVPSANRQSKR